MDTEIENRLRWSENTGMYALIIVIVLVIVVAVGGVFAIMRYRTQEQAACIASGRAYVIDHYTTTYISQKVGTTTITTPVQSPVYACVEQ